MSVRDVWGILLSHDLQLGFKSKMSFNHALYIMR